MCSAYPPPQGMTHSKSVTNPAMAERIMSACMHDNSRWIGSFNCDSLDGRNIHPRILISPQPKVYWSQIWRPRMPSTRGLLATDHVILNHGQVTWTTPELAPPLLTTTPHQREDVSALDRFNVHRCPTRRVFSGTGLEPVTKQATSVGLIVPKRKHLSIKPFNTSQPTPPLWRDLRKNSLVADLYSMNCRETLTTSFSDSMVYHHTGQPTWEITSMSIFLTDELDELWTTTYHLPNGFPEVLTL
ncbi:uncharacterized protein TNCV_3303781 [Trichonephila clavipes]|nr:uncharacterized protein TNCV_3303781 [Trichonephila clavipes]